MDIPDAPNAISPQRACQAYPQKISNRLFPTGVASKTIADERLFEWRYRARARPGVRVELGLHAGEEAGKDDLGSRDVEAARQRSRSARAEQTARGGTARQAHRQPIIQATQDSLSFCRFPFHTDRPNYSI